MDRIDRLSALISRFEITVTLADAGHGNLIVVGPAVAPEGAQQNDPQNGEGAGSAGPLRVEFFPDGRRGGSADGKAAAVEIGPDEVALVEAQADLGGDSNPLVGALPQRVSLLVAHDDETMPLLQFLASEARQRRCGGTSVLSRLGEVLIIRLLRAEIERGEARIGLLAGLADPRISRAIVALHENPGKDWRNEDLARVSGLSLSRFSEVFQNHLAQSPQNYLRGWRMTLARQDVERGDRIKAVSSRYGYKSQEAFAKAFQRQFGTNPLALRH